MPALQGKADELLLPVLKVFDERQSQLTMDSFLHFSQRFAKIRSSRLQKAVAGIARTHNPDLHFADTSSPDPKPKGKRGKKGKGHGLCCSEAESG